MTASRLHIFFTIGCLLFFAHGRDSSNGRGQNHQKMVRETRQSLTENQDEPLHFPKHAGFTKFSSNLISSRHKILVTSKHKRGVVISNSMARDEPLQKRIIVPRHERKHKAELSEKSRSEIVKSSRKHKLVKLLSKKEHQFKTSHKDNAVTESERADSNKFTKVATNDDTDDASKQISSGFKRSEEMLDNIGADDFDYFAVDDKKSIEPDPVAGNNLSTTLNPETTNLNLQTDTTKPIQSSNPFQRELTELATKHFVIRIYAKDSDTSFDTIPLKPVNRSIPTNDTVGRKILVDKPMLRNKTGLVLQEEGNLTREVKQALKDVFLDKLLNEFDNETQKKNLDAHLSYPYPLPDEFLYSTITVGNKTVRVARNDTLQNSTVPSSSLNNCSVTLEKGKEVNMTLPATSSPESGYLSQEFSNNTSPCSLPQNTTGISPPVDESGAFPAYTNESKSEAFPAYKNESKSEAFPAYKNESKSEAFPAYKNESKSEHASDYSSSAQNMSTNFNNTGLSEQAAPAMDTNTGMSDASTSQTSNDGGSHHGSSGNSAINSSSNEIEIVNLETGKEDEKSNSIMNKLCRLKNTKEECDKIKEGGKIRIKGGRKKIIAMFVKFLEDVAKKLKLDVLSIAEKLVEELEDKEEKKRRRVERPQTESKTFSDLVPKEYLPIMKSLTSDIEKDLDEAVTKMSSSNQSDSIE